MALAAATLRRYLLLLAQEHLEFRLPVSASRGRGQDWGWGRGRGVGPLRRRVGEALPSGAARGVPGRCPGGGGASLLPAPGGAGRAGGWRGGGARSPFPRRSALPLAAGVGFRSAPGAVGRWL